MIDRIAARLKVFDPGFVSTRRGVRAVGATVLGWATMLAVTATFDVADPARITLFAAGAAFEGALWAADPQPKDRVRTLGWVAVVVAMAVFTTVQLVVVAAWIAAALLVLLMFCSYALRPWSPRVASLALMAAITVYVTGGGHITVGRIGWFVLAAVIGLGWLAVWEAVILPDDPLRALRQSVQVFSRWTADTVADVMGVLDSVTHGTPSDHPRKALRANLARVQACRDAIGRQLPGAIVHGLGEANADQLRVALHSAQKGLEEMADSTDATAWARSLPDELARSISSSLNALADGLRHYGQGESKAVAEARAQVVREHLHDALARTTATGSAAFEPATLLATLTLVGGGEVAAQSITQAMTLAAATPSTTPADAAPPDPSPQPDGPRLSPTMALAVQSAVAAVAAGLVARLVGNEQSLVVAWTAFVVVAGSAGLSTRRAVVRIPATILGAVGGVLVAATVPDTVGWTIAVVAVGVFFTIVSAPMSYPAMVFWISIVFVPLFATEGRYLDLIMDKTVAALIGGCVAAAVALTVVPIRATREVRPATLQYLAALDAALASHLPGNWHDPAVAEATLDSAHAALTTKVRAAATEINVLAQPENIKNDEAIHVDAVHDAYLRLTSLLSESSRRLHGWSDDDVSRGVHRLRDAVARTEQCARGDECRTKADDDERVPTADQAASLGLSDSVRRIENLGARLADLAVVLGEGAARPAPH